MSKPALFLDRDGVINVDHGYVHKPEDFDFVDGIFELVKCANKFGYFTVVVTNQAGIGRGYYNENDFENITQWMRQQFILQGAVIDAVYFSPYHPEFGVGKYLKQSDCRKPAPGMLIRAAQENDIDLQKSILLGDNFSDIQAGINAGVKNLFILGKNPQDSHCLMVHKPSDVIQYMKKINDAA